MNPYLYCGGDPVNAVDPTGKELVTCLIIIGVGLCMIPPVTLAADAAGGASVRIPEANSARDAATVAGTPEAEGAANEMCKQLLGDQEEFIGDATRKTTTLNDSFWQIFAETIAGQEIPGLRDSE